MDKLIFFFFFPKLPGLDIHQVTSLPVSSHSYFFIDYFIPFNLSCRNGTEMNIKIFCFPQINCFLNPLPTVDSIIYHHFSNFHFSLPSISSLTYVCRTCCVCVYIYTHTLHALKKKWLFIKRLSLNVPLGCSNITLQYNNSLLSYLYYLCFCLFKEGNRPS